MITIASLLKQGVKKAVRGFAVELVRGLTYEKPGPKKSPLVRAVEKIRREFDIPKTRAGYELARQAFRESVKDVRRADKETARQAAMIAKGGQTAWVPYEGPHVGKLVEYTIFVDLVSNRSDRGYRGQVQIAAIFGTDERILAEKARDMVKRREITTLYIKGSKNYGVQPLQSWELARYEVFAIDFIEPKSRPLSSD